MGSSTAATYDDPYDASAAAREGAEESEECISTLSGPAHEMGLSTYDLPDECRLMVVCAGSPRAASTAECLIAQDVIDLILEAQHKRGLTNETRSIQAGYFNYHLHTFCDDTDCGKTYPEGPIENAEEWRAAAGHIPDKAKRKEVYHSIDTLQAFNKAVAKATKHSAVIVKSHEFDADLMEVCNKRMILTSTRDKEEVFDSAVDLGWFESPKSASRGVFNKYFDIWKNYRRCWTEAAKADSYDTRVYDLPFAKLENDYTFREEVYKLTKLFAGLMGVDKETLDIQAIVDAVTAEDFEQDLNPMLSTGNAFEDEQEQEQDEKAREQKREEPEEKDEEEEEDESEAVV